MGVCVLQLTLTLSKTEHFCSLHGGSEESRRCCNTRVAGNLNIAAVKPEDIDNTKVWQCYIYNTVLDLYAGGSHTKIVSSEEQPGKYIDYFYLHQAHLICI